MLEVSNTTGARRWAALATALLVLNTSLTFANIWPTLGIRWTPQVSVEVAACVLCLAAAGQWLGGVSRRWLRGLAMLWVVLVIARYGDVTTRSLYGRDINLYWDLQFVPDVSAMFAVVA